MRGLNLGSGIENEQASGTRVWGGNESSRSRALGSSTRAKGDGRESVPCKRRARDRLATPCWQGSKVLFLQVWRAGGRRSGIGSWREEWRAALPTSSAKEPWPLIFCSENRVAACVFSVTNAGGGGCSLCVRASSGGRRRHAEAVWPTTGGAVRVLGLPKCFGPN